MPLAFPALTAVLNSFFRGDVECFYTMDSTLTSRLQGHIYISSLVLNHHLQLFNSGMWSVRQPFCQASVGGTDVLAPIWLTLCDSSGVHKQFPKHCGVRGQMPVLNGFHAPHPSACTISSMPVTNMFNLHTCSHNLPVDI